MARNKKSPREKFEYRIRRMKDELRLFVQFAVQAGPQTQTFCGRELSKELEGVFTSLKTGKIVGTIEIPAEVIRELQALEQ